MAKSTISYLWCDQNAPQGFRSGVSLHSHTNQSKETLDFLANFGHQYPTSLPISSNPSTNGVRLFLNALFEAPCGTASGAPNFTFSKSPPIMACRSITRPPIGPRR